MRNSLRWLLENKWKIQPQRDALKWVLFPNFDCNITEL